MAFNEVIIIFMFNYTGVLQRILKLFIESKLDLMHPVHVLLRILIGTHPYTYMYVCTCICKDPVSDIITNETTVRYTRTQC